MDNAFSTSLLVRRNHADIGAIGSALKLNISQLLSGWETNDAASSTFFLDCVSCCDKFRFKKVVSEKVCYYCWADAIKKLKTTLLPINITLSCFLTKFMKPRLVVLNYLSPKSLQWS